jgi:hypothetical protein
VTASQTASVTAWGDLKANVTSSGDGVEAFAGHDMTGDIQATTWADLEAQHDVTSKVQAGSEAQYADVSIRAGNDLRSPTVESGGRVEASVTGNMVVPTVTALGGDFSLTVDGSIAGIDNQLYASEQATIWAGGFVSGQLTAADVEITAGDNVAGSVRATAGKVYVHSGGNELADITATQEVTVEAGGLVSATVSGGPGVSVVANGDIQGNRSRVE